MSTALRLTSLIIAAKTVLIGLVSWRRAKIMGLDGHVRWASVAGFVGVIAIGLAIAAAAYVAARHYDRNRTG